MKNVFTRGIGKSNGLFHRPLLPPSATRPHRRTQAGRVGGRAPAPGGAGLRLPGGGWCTRRGG